MEKPRINQKILSKRLERVEVYVEQSMPAELDKLSARVKELEERAFMNKAVLTSAEAAEYVGISRSQLYKLTFSNRIPHYKPRGKMVYFDREELDDWMKRGGNSNNQEPTTNPHDYDEKKEQSNIE